MPKPETRAPNTADQKRRQLASLRDAINVICDSWDDAVEAAESRGYGSHTSDDPPVSGGGTSDPTGSDAIREDIAEQWVFTTRRSLALLLKLAVDDEYPLGTFYPPSLRSALNRAAEDVVELWPTNVARLITRIHVSANTARAEWPPTPTAGQRIKDIVVGERAPQLEICVECGTPVTGVAADPIRRINGQPHHMNPCYETARKRKYRASRVPPVETCP